MNSFEYVIKEKIGIHARPAGLLVKEAKRFSSDFTLEHNGKKADMKKLIMLMALGVKYNDKVTVYAEGDKAEEEIKYMQKFFEDNL
ncbi:HPr family phosphocarrier protein [Petroclostridium sp. X23]|uniref:HPr family phosphocarrier protein n=1 Tax=Petroclostridium sp. X23 TaxID=3045146 RepID=UPI0024ADC75A|nr:HPr family phosphocarrier protein [Petroclostridium sp. X23]WHH57151.1 HPr family phosphocarrier protein [Petroclostridium sp. X23]